eukprot:12874520-Alexandrium_andersonii.AAC.1
MSASLVGSEMCIRDSCATLAKGSQNKLAIPRIRDFGPLGLSFIREIRSCLLYTSDAADDM